MFTFAIFGLTGNVLVCNFAFDWSDVTSDLTVFSLLQELKIGSSVYKYIGKSLPYLRAHKHVSVPVYFLYVQLIMRSTTSLYPSFALFQTTFWFWKRNKLNATL